MCIFCQIIHGEIPSKTIYEDDMVKAIMDIHPVTKGHVLVMPKKHCVDFLDADLETLHQVIDVTHKLANHLTKVLDAKGMNILTNCKEVSGQSVDHLHFHIIPRYTKEEFGFKETPCQVDLDELYEQIKYEKTLEQ